MHLGEGRDHLSVCAVSTPMGYGGISVIRISGPKSFEIVKKSLKSDQNLLSHRAFLTNFQEASSGKILDEVMILPFEKGKSFTGEESVEISCHGSPVICGSVLKELCANGAVMAINGEFTYRSFMNDRLDLIQAESVLSLIHSHSQLGSELALRQLKGELSLRLSSLKENIVWCLAHIEAGIDFSEQGIIVVEDKILSDRLEAALGELNQLLNSYETGRILKDGIVLVLSGEPNVGKSSLMNVLLSMDRSIVSDIAGTTRDVIRDDLIYKNLKFTVVDTAGIRMDSNDPIERMGVDRSLKERQEGFLNIVILDASKALSGQNGLIFDGLNLERTFFVLNKVDLLDEAQVLEKRSEFKLLLGSLFGLIAANGFSNRLLFTSSLATDTKNQILDVIYDYWIGKYSHIESVAVSSARQREELKLAQKLLIRVVEGLSTQLGSEFIAFDLKESLMSLQRVVGEVYDDQILDKIFKEFCLGK